MTKLRIRIETFDLVNDVVLTPSKSIINLLIVKGAMKFVLEKIAQQNTTLSQLLYDSLLKRYLERRNEDVISLLIFLQTIHKKKQKNSLILRKLLSRIELKVLLRDSLKHICITTITQLITSMKANQIWIKLFQCSQLQKKKYETLTSKN